MPFIISVYVLYFLTHHRKSISSFTHNMINFCSKENYEKEKKKKPVIARRVKIELGVIQVVKKRADVNKVSTILK